MADKVALSAQYQGEGDRLFEQGKYDQAYRSYSIGIQMHDKNLACFLGRSWACMKMGNNHAALDDATAATDVDPRDDNAVLFRAMAHHNLGNLEEALKDYRAAAELNPENEDALDGIEELEEEGVTAAGGASAPPPAAAATGGAGAPPPRPAKAAAPAPAADGAAQPPPRPPKKAMKRKESSTYVKVNRSGMEPSAPKLIGEHGTIPRDLAETRLRDAGMVNGMYLLRKKKEQHMVLSRVKGTVFVHDLIEQTRAPGGGAAYSINGKPTMARSMAAAVAGITATLKAQGLVPSALPDPNI